jgi:hypothetical protein
MHIKHHRQTIHSHICVVIESTEQTINGSNLNVTLIMTLMSQSNCVEVNQLLLPFGEQFFSYSLKYFGFRQYYKQNLLV